MTDLTEYFVLGPGSQDIHPKCKLFFDEITGEYDCHYKSRLDCDDCKYGVGHKDPEAKCNKL